MRLSEKSYCRKAGREISQLFRPFRDITKKITQSIAIACSVCVSKHALFDTLGGSNKEVLMLVMKHLHHPNCPKRILTPGWLLQFKNTMILSGVATPKVGPAAQLLRLLVYLEFCS